MRKLTSVLIFLVIVCLTQASFISDSFSASPQSTKKLQSITTELSSKDQDKLDKISSDNTIINQRINDFYSNTANYFSSLSSAITWTGSFLAILVTVLLGSSIVQYFSNKKRIDDATQKFLKHTDEEANKITKLREGMEQSQPAPDGLSKINIDPINLDNNSISDITNAFEEIDKAIEKTINSFPKENIFAAAYKAHQSGFYAKAIILYRQFIKLAPESSNAYNNIGLAFTSMEKIGYTEGLKYYDIALSKDTNNIIALSNKAIALYEKDEYEKSLQYFNRIPIDDANVYNYRGLIYEKTGDFQRGLACFEKAKSLAPQIKILQYNVIGALILNNKIEEAEKLILQEDLIQPNAHTAKVFGHLHLLGNNPSEALKSYELALTRLQPEEKREFILHIIKNDIPAGKMAFPDKLELINEFEMWIKKKLEEI